MSAYLPYLITGGFTLAGIVIGILLTRILNRDETRAASLADINTKMTTMASQISQGILDVLVLKGKVIEMDEKYSKLKQDYKDLKTKHENLTKQFDIVRDRDSLHSKQADTWHKQLIESGIDPKYVTIE